MVCLCVVVNPQLLTLNGEWFRWRLPITLDQFCGVCLAWEEEEGGKKKRTRIL